MESGGLPCAWGYTDAAGLASFPLGNQLGYTLEISHDLLGVPSGAVLVGTDQPGPIPVAAAFVGVVARLEGRLS